MTFMYKLKETTFRLTVVITILMIATNRIYCQNKALMSIPFQLIDNRPFIEVKINNIKFHFMVDCGGINAIDADVTDQLGLRKYDKKEVQGAGEKPAAIWSTNVKELIVGNDTSNEVKLISISLKSIKENLNLPYLDGLIGYDYFKGKIMQIDYPKKLIHFYASFIDSDPVSFSLFSSRIPLIKAFVGKDTLDLLIDTGDRSELTFLKHTAQKLKISNHYELSDIKITGYGVGGPVYAKTFVLEQLKINNRHYKNIKTRIPDAMSGLFALTDIDGSIGSGFLKNYILTISYIDNKLYLKPSS